MDVFNEEATTFADHWAGLPAPAQREIADALQLTEGTRLLDVGCGSGHFCAQALARGAHVSGIDAAPAMIAIASRVAPGADFCVGPMDELPWPDDTFDAVTSFNSLQFADDPDVALREWVRVAKPGAAIAICVWGPREECELDAVWGAVSTEPPAPRFCERLVETVATAGLTLSTHATVSVPYEVRDRERFELGHGFLARGVAGVPEAEALAAMVSAAEPFRRPDGSYRLENTFRYALSAVPSPRPTPAAS
ncbi:methyltransferase domain-containing protein [Solirubrobacter ginsenosidimutans]|uniref:Methyltransferase domain-containing protein n=1 Tax=Solirubrobacter ginsenosidimutans TaxID=490573 RepID=A0A9X3MWH7_9ACTN|nr:class I SAM-dependent methyltransferase [Solirubrobacter ginsenosidimutans]MDA0164196.1 methyltransferase domain-containing protein [Solirubrobacter ginsenosidimutans]